MSRPHGFDPKREDIRCALENGWVFERYSGTQHLVFGHAGTPRKINLPGSPGRGRGMQNARAKIRRYTPREDTTA